ncbi:hypothetical protein MC7420_7289 [Coleofasciculus chthonoplastes PCC 7420]|uniref:Uncharacterized protein n=1 Tax=Coleofasciculus chthonoplastes PCC 7420 TaxID=118168 RepID=B4VHZ2_9CYAN|nr:hypothetical protein MC7420_7289 [Coleofasciculus chthonoplastes PCC 7420]
MTLHDFRGNLVLHFDCVGAGLGIFVSLSMITFVQNPP